MIELDPLHAPSPRRPRRLVRSFAKAGALACRLGLVVAVAFGTSVAAAPQAAPTRAIAPRADLQTRAEWFVIRIADTPVGSLEVRTVEEDGLLVESARMGITLNRMGSVVTMKSALETRETPDGRLRTAQMDLTLSTQSTSTTAVVEPGVVRVGESAGERRFEREVPYEGVLLGPSGARRLAARELRGVGDEVSWKTFSGELGTVVEMTRRVVARSRITVDGREVQALEVVESSAALPVPTSVWLDSEGRVLRSSMASPFGLTETVVADQVAARLASAGGELPEESYRATLARTQVRIPQPRRAERVLLQITHRNPGLGWPSLEGPRQRVVASSDERVILEVRSSRPPSPGAPRAVDASEELRPYLEPNAYLQSDQPELVALADEIVGDEADAYRAMLALERWVSENLEFDMGVVMAPSNEILEQRRGTCTEYAVLLTALTRAAGIPGRFVMGWVYVGGIFGGHAWTEARIGDDWVAFDGAVPADGPADAARIAFLRSALDEGIGALSLGPGAQLYGQVDIAVLEVEGDGYRGAWEADAPAFELEGDLYRAPSLGLELRRPAGWSWGELDTVWPETSLLGLEGPGGRTAVLEVRDRPPWKEAAEAAADLVRRVVPAAEPTPAEVDGARALRAEAGGSAVVAWARGSEVWRLRVEGEGAGVVLDRMLEGLRLGPAGG